MDTGWRGFSARGSSSVCNAHYYGDAGCYNYNIARYAVRPVVSIPKSNIIKTALGI